MTATKKETLVKIPTGDGPYVRAKHAQLLEKDPERAIALFWAAINAGDRVDSALKDMAIVMKQQNRAEEAIEAIRSFRKHCSIAAQPALDNLLLDLYKKCGRIEDQIELLKHKLNLIHTGLIFNGKRTKTARSQGKKFQISIRQEATRLLGNLGWAYMQLHNYIAAEAVYRKALLLDPDNNKLCNLGMCLMKQERFGEAKVVLGGAMPIGPQDGRRPDSDSHMRSYERAQTLLKELLDLSGSSATSSTTSTSSATSSTTSSQSMSPPPSPSTLRQATSPVSFLTLPCLSGSSTASSPVASSSPSSMPELLEDLPEFDPWSRQWKLDVWESNNNMNDGGSKCAAPFASNPGLPSSIDAVWPAHEHAQVKSSDRLSTNGAWSDPYTASASIWNDQWKAHNGQSWDFNNSNHYHHHKQGVQNGYGFGSDVIDSVMDAIDMNYKVENSTNGSVDTDSDEVEDEYDERKFLQRNSIIQQHRFRIFQHKELSLAHSFMR